LSIYELAALCSVAREFSEATGVISELLEKGKNYRKRDFVSISARGLLGCDLISQGDYDTREDYLWMTLSSHLVDHGPQNAKTIQIYYLYRQARDTQQPTFRGRKQRPEVSCDAFEGLLRYFPRRRAKSLGCKSRLDP
jgi:hypothetical protein